MYFPKLSKESLEHVPQKSAAMFGLTRLEEAKFSNPIVRLSDSISVHHTSLMDSRWAFEVKGQECWSSEEIETYYKSNERNKSETINSYVDSDIKRTHSFDYQSPFNNSEYYILQEIVQEDAENFSTLEMQDRFERELNSALISLSLLSNRQIRWAPPLRFYKFPNSSHASAVMSSSPQRKMFRNSGVWECSTQHQECLKKVFKSLFEKKHSESYLAALRFQRSQFRPQPDDQIIDLMIALEAILSEGSEVGIKIRISHRLARLLKKKKRDRIDIHSIIREAYNFRSALVHGGKRQADFLEEILRPTEHPKKGLIATGKALGLAERLGDLLNAAILSRYIEHGDVPIAALRDKLDSMSI